MAKIISKVIVSVALLAAGAVYFFLEYEYKPYLRSPLNKGASAIVYNFAPGTSVKKLINDLQSRDIITKPQYIKAYIRFNLDSTKFKAGVYEIKPAMQTPIELFAMLLSGKVKTVKVRIREGWALSKVLENLALNQDLSHPVTDLDVNEVKINLDLNLPSLEGMLYPDTYVIEPGMSDLSLIKLAYDSMLENLQKEWQNRSDKIQVKTPYEALILASIIEKETAIKNERFLISGVFNKRLKKKMRLQTDPTIIYGMGERFKGNLTKKDLKTDGPFNTYTRSGLPPTPICLPSLSSINAALHPAETKALFFVSKGDGTHYFSNTYKEHRQAVKKYQIEPYKRRKAKEKAARLAKELAEKKTNNPDSTDKDKIKDKD